MLAKGKNAPLLLYQHQKGEYKKLSTKLCIPVVRTAGLTVGAAIRSIMPQVDALFFSRSDITPAKIPPAKKVKMTEHLRALYRFKTCKVSPAKAILLNQ